MLHFATAHTCCLLLAEASNNQNINRRRRKRLRNAGAGQAAPAPPPPPPPPPAPRPQNSGLGRSGGFAHIHGSPVRMPPVGRVSCSNGRHTPFFGTRRFAAAADNQPGPSRDTGSAPASLSARRTRRFNNSTLSFDVDDSDVDMKYQRYINKEEDSDDYV